MPLEEWYAIPMEIRAAWAEKASAIQNKVFDCHWEQRSVRLMIEACMECEGPV
jgi:hypothetical protein